MQHARRLISEMTGLAAPRWFAQKLINPESILADTYVEYFTVNFTVSSTSLQDETNLQVQCRNDGLALIDTFDTKKTLTRTSLTLNSLSFDIGEGIRLKARLAVLKLELPRSLRDAQNPNCGQKGRLPEAIAIVLNSAFFDDIGHHLSHDVSFWFLPHELRMRYITIQVTINYDALPVGDVRACDHMLAPHTKWK
ncbi:hypothetical protein E4T56_gene18466 [Termitomyces sp. T112]|nr:hypothetical protein E4T56_gene18466 [Termitomyces sp. T112]